MTLCSYGQWMEVSLHPHPPDWWEWSMSNGSTILGLVLVAVSVVFIIVGLFVPVQCNDLDESNHDRDDLYDRGDRAREAKPRKVRK